jgi:Tol biopolymer transport system component
MRHSSPNRVVVALMVFAACGGVFVAWRAWSRTSGAVAGDGASEAIGMSADGRLVAFVSVASNLVAGDRNKRPDLFVYDRVSGKLQRSDVGHQLAASGSTASTSSLRFLAFTDVRPGRDAEGCDDVFVYDRATGKTEQIDLNRRGAPGAMSAEFGSCSTGAVLSAGGRFAAFSSASSDLVAGDRGTSRCSSGDCDGWDVFVRDRATHTTELVSESSGAEQANGDSSVVAISADGRLVYFSSQATNLTADGEKGGLFVRDRLAKTTRRVAIPAGIWDGYSLVGVVSAEARFVAFSVEHKARDGRVLRPADLWVYERATGKSVPVRVTKSGARANAAVDPVSVSANGRYVVFRSSATNLAAPSAHVTCVVPAEYDPGGGLRSAATRYPCPDLYVTDRATGKTELLTAGRDGQPANGKLDDVYKRVFVSADGRYAVFTSSAPNLTAGHDANKAADVFLRDLKTHTTTLISAAR